MLLRAWPRLRLWTWPPHNLNPPIDHRCLRPSLRHRTVHLKDTHDCTNTDTQQKAIGRPHVSNGCLERNGLSQNGLSQRLLRTQHVTASISSCGNHAIATQCPVKNVPPASGGIVHAICRFLQSCSNIWMTRFWWQLTYDITIHIMRLSLKESCFQINVDKIPGCLVGNPGLVDAGESVCRSSFCLSWKPRSTNPAFALWKLPCLSVLMKSTHRPVTQFFGLTFLRSMGSKT